jgi:biotin operon repressor
MIRHLNRGADAAVSIGTLAERLNLSRRAVERALEEAAHDGLPIISGAQGVWLAETAQEAREQADRLDHRAAAIHARAAALRRWADAQEAEQGVMPWAA